MEHLTINEGAYTVAVEVNQRIVVHYEPSEFELETEHFWNNMLSPAAKESIVIKLQNSIQQEFREFMSRRNEDWGLSLANLIEDACEAESKDIM